MTERIPLVVDLDGSYLRVDSLHELIARNLRSPRLLLSASWAGLRRGKAAFKAQLSTGQELDVAKLPRNAMVTQYVADQAAAGRTVVLATGADRAVADAVRREDSAFSDVISSDGSVNLTDSRKAQALVDRFGARGFDYVGNSRADVSVWAVSRAAIVAGHRRPSRPLRSVAFEHELIEPAPSSLRLWARQLRLHQSAKNVLLFLPLIAAHQIFNLDLLGRAALGFIAFTAMASAVYLLNDVLDIDVDRAHRKKRFRPIAAGWISPVRALAVGAGLAVAGFALGSALGSGFFVVLLGYALLTLSYSWTLKRITLIDVITLALLYMVRIFAGAVATGIELSFWFTGVTLFLFLSLAFVKRYSEIITHSGSENVPGRGYRSGDQHVIMALGVASGIAALLLLANYIQSPAVSALYPAAQALWISIPIVFYWFANVWMTASRGEMHEDPVVFALRNRRSLAAATVAAAVFVLATLDPLARVFDAVFP